MKSFFAFRTDASIDIASGHVMRCLALAESLKNKHIDCIFICRDHRGNLINLIKEKGFYVVTLPANQKNSASDLKKVNGRGLYSCWLGAAWYIDAEETMAALSGMIIEWLVVDHYSIDVRWQNKLRSICKHIFVIDDLADRQHDCDVLLDQNLGRSASDYKHHLIDKTELLIGPKYALLRSEFLLYREASLSRRIFPKIKNILISMGGVDKKNITSKVLYSLLHCELSNDIQITVIMGQNAPWLLKVSQLAELMPWQTRVLENVKDMAKLMIESDLVIGAAGSSAWERCCLGLPTILVEAAENQREIVNALTKAGAVVSVKRLSMIDDMKEFFSSVGGSPTELKNLSERAAKLTDGQGTDRVCNRLMMSI